MKNQVLEKEEINYKENNQKTDTYIFQYSFFIRVTRLYICYYDI